MRLLLGSAVLMLVSFISWPMRAEDDLPVLVAVNDVFMANLSKATICDAAAPNPKRPDRVKLAQLAAKLPDPNASYPFGYSVITPVAFAVLADDVKLVDSLFAKGAHWRKDESDELVMYEAARHGSPDMVAALLRHGLTPNMHLTGGWSPLMVAAAENRLDNVMVLLEAGADATVVMPSGMSALRGAVVCKNQKMINALLLKGARPDEKTRLMAEKRGVDVSGS